jgi:hypothetical protein
LQGRLQRHATGACLHLEGGGHALKEGGQQGEEGGRRKARQGMCQQCNLPCMHALSTAHPTDHHTTTTIGCSVQKYTAYPGHA